MGWVWAPRSFVDSTRSRAHNAGVEIRVLGDLTIDGGHLSPKERSLLAALVLRTGNVVTPSELADAVWRDDVPTTWPKQVQAAIGHVRRALGPSSIATSRAGYRLRVDPESIDAVRYERLIESAVLHRANGDPARSIDILERASSLWTGAAYSDLGEWPPAVAEAERLSEIRRTAEEELQAVRLECGEHRAVVADAERLVRAEPLRERRWAILATALYRSGRQADALSTLRAARERFADELGIEPGAELVNLESAILRQDPFLAAPPAPPRTSTECPYRGLQPFGTADADEFFGRDDDIRSALARLARSPFLAVSGPSGSGKSSLVLAGIVPALRGRGDDAIVLASGGIATSAVQDALSARGGTNVVVIDQFEELLHLGLPDSQVADVCATIADAVASGRSIVLVVRSDFLGECATEPSIGPLFAEGVHLVGPLTSAGLRRAIEEPARLAGLRLEAGLTELILRDAADEPGALPHVSHALVETWLRREGATLTVAGYEDSGGISGAIAKSADNLYRSLDPAQQEICRSTFLRLVEISADGAPMRRRISLKPLRADAAHDQLLTSLARARLVSAEEDSLMVAHESLALAWPRLRGWLEEDADGMRTMHSLATAASTWETDGRPAEDLYRGARLKTALEWRQAASPELTGTEEAFLEASVDLEHDAVEEIASRAKHDRRQNRRLRGLLAAAVGLFIVASTAGGLVAAGSVETAAQRETAQIEALTSSSLALRSTERDVAALLAAEAYRRWPDDPRTRSALMGVMTGSHGMLATTYIEGAGAMSGVLVPGTRQAVAVTEEREVAVYDIDTGTLVRRLDVPRDIRGVDTRHGPAVSLDGRRVAVAERPFESTDVRLTVVDVASGERVMGPIDLDFPLSSITMNADGSMVAAIDELGDLRLIDVDDGDVQMVTGTVTHEAQTDSALAGSVRFTQDGRLVYGTVEGPLLIVDTDTAMVVSSLPMPTESANVSMTVLADDRVVVSGDRRVAAVDLASGEVEWRQEFAGGLAQPCSWVAASIELVTVYCGDQWGQVEERSLSTGAPTGRTFSPQLGYVGTLAVTTEGRELVIVGRGEPAITRWMLDGSGAVTRLVAPGWSIQDAYSPVGSRLVIGRRVEGMRSGEDYREHAVLDTRTGEMAVRTPIPSLGVMWVGAETLVGDLGGIGPEYAAYFDVKTARSFHGDPLPDDAVGMWMSADGDHAYLGRSGGEVWTIDPGTGRRIDPTLQVTGDPWIVTTNEDGTEVLVTSVSRTDPPSSTIFDGVTGKALRSGLEGAAWTRMTSRGEVIAATNNRIGRYDAATFERLGSLPGIPGGIDAIGVSPDGRTLSVYSMNETVSVYDLVAGIRLGDPIQVSSEWTFSGVFRADGDEMAVNVPAGIALWDLRTSSQADAACAMAGRDLTEDEWLTYLADLGEYRATCAVGDGQPVAR